MGVVRIYLVAFVVLTAFYILLRLYSRSLRREKLEKRWDEERPEGVDRLTYVKDGLASYDHSVRPKLLGLVYVLPFVVIGATIYVINW